MTTLNKSILPIPEEVVVGSGSYTVPVNKYAYIAAVSSVGGSAGAQRTNAGDGYSASAGGAVSSNNSWLVEGTTINTSSSFPSGNNTITSGTTEHRTGLSRVNINGQPITSAYVSASTSGDGGGTTLSWNFTGENSWVISLFSIPKQNFPESLKEGN